MAQRKPDPKIIVSSPTTSKQYNYRKGDVTLNFSLRSDVKQQMKDFVELLQKAVVDVTNDIKSK